jgi:dipeptidyl aminopeptidase/acylaminoacyl peptidase
VRVAVLACLALVAVACDVADDAASGVDGDRIVFASSRAGDFEIYTMRPDGSDVRQLTANRSDEATPVWSPDGTLVAFRGATGDSDDALVHEVFVMRADGSDRKRLTDNRLLDLVSGWTADGDVVSWRCRGRTDLPPCELLVIEPDGSGERRVFETPNFVLVSVGAFDGEVYASLLNPDARSLEDARRYAIDVETGAARPARDGIPLPGGENRLIETDKDENGSCLFHDCIGHAPEIYVDDRRLTHTKGYDHHARWSPRGQRIVFARIANDDGDDYELWVMNADGSCETQLTDNRVWDWEPDWHGSAGTDRPLDC